MSSDVLRQPQTFWQWLTNQPGTLYVPGAPPKSRQALDVLEKELYRLHCQMDNVREDITFHGDSEAYLQLVQVLDKLHTELVRRSQEESK